MRIFMENDIAAEPFRTTQEGMRHPQAIHNRNIVDLSDPRVGPTKQLGVLADFGTTPMEAGGPAPALGADTAAVLSGLDGEAPPAPRPVSTPPRAPLEGLQVLEFASYIAGPYATALLADLGARVIKVEPVTGDAYRVMSFPRMCKTLQGKESFAIDLKDERGRRALHKLIENTDILLHNFRPGVPERLGMDYETAKRLNPGIVYLYAGAYGSTGPHSHRTGFHPIAAAITGGPRYQLGRDLPTPPEVPLDLDGVHAMSDILRRANESNPDPVAALTHCAAILMGLYHRARTGEGQYIETSMLSANLYANADDAIRYEGKPERPLADADFNGTERRLPHLPLPRGVGLPGLPPGRRVGGPRRRHRRTARRPRLLRQARPPRTRRRHRRSPRAHLRRSRRRGMGAPPPPRRRPLRPARRPR